MHAFVCLPIVGRFGLLLLLLLSVACQFCRPVCRLPVLSACLPPVNSAEAAAGFPAPCVLQVTGCIKYNGQEASQFVLRRTAAYVDQLDYHIPSLTVRGGLVVGPCVCW